MKRLLAISICVFTIVIAKAQTIERDPAYFTAELNLGNYSGIDLNFNYIFKNDYSIRVGYTGNWRRAKSLPENYSPGLFSLFTFFLIDPFDQMQNFQISYGRILYLNEKQTIRANLSIGVGYTVITEPENWQKISPAFFISNYSWEYKSHNTVSLIINPKIEFPLTRFYGLTISPMAQISIDRAYYGIGIGQMLGRLKRY